MEIDLESTPSEADALLGSEWVLGIRFLFSTDSSHRPGSLRFMKAFLFLIALALLAPPRDGLAQDDANPESSAHRAAAEKLMSLMAPREMFIAAFVSGVAPLFEQLKKGGIDDAKIEQVREASLDLATQVADDPEMTKQLADVYMAEFSEGEIEELLAFYNTPLGAKTLKKLPTLFQKGAMIGKQLTEKHQAAFQAKLQSILGAGPGPAPTPAPASGN